MSEPVIPQDHAKPPAFPWQELVPLKWRYIGLFILCVVVSILGVVRAIHLCDKTEGGRGGAIAAIVALTTFLLRRDYGAWQYKDRIDNMKADLTPDEQLVEKVSALEQAIGINAYGQSVSNWWLAGSTAVGTIFWGFGDVFASWFIH